MCSEKQEQSLSISVFVVVDTAVKLGNAHERRTRLFLALWLILQRLGGGGGGFALICLQYLFTSAKTDKFWEK